MSLSENRRLRGKPLGLRFKSIVLVLAVLAILLVSAFSKPTEKYQPTVPATSLIIGTVEVTVTWCGTGTCDPWENYYNCPQDCPKPWVLFVSPTPRNEVTTYNWVLVNVTLNSTANLARLEWNGANETMGGSGLNFYKNKTGIANGNYTFMVWANLTTGWNSSETRWVYVNYTAPPVPPTPPAPPTPGPGIAPPAPPIKFERTINLSVRPVIEEQRPAVALTDVILNLKQPLTYEPEIEAEIISCQPYQNIIYSHESTYQCLLVETNIREEDFYNATIKFKTRKSWVTENNINISTIKLVKKLDNNTRQGLLTWQVGEDEEFIYSEALTYSFSVFIILSEPITPLPVVKPHCGDGICDITIGEGCGTCPEDCVCAPGETCIRNTCIPECCLWGICGKFIICWYWWLAIVLFIVSIAISSAVAIALYERRILQKFK